MISTNLTFSNAANGPLNLSTIAKQAPSSTKLKSVLAAFILLLLLFTSTHLMKFPGSVANLMSVTSGQKTLDLQASFSNTDTYNRLEAFGEVGRAAYIRTILTVDLIFPLSMFLFLFLLAKYTSQQAGFRLNKVLRIFPFAYLALDFLENLFILILLSNFPESLEFLGSFVGYLTIGKRASMILALLMPTLIFSGRKLYSLYEKRPNHKEMNSGY